MAEAGGESVSEQGTPRPWRCRGPVHFDPQHWSKAGFSLYPIFVPHDGFAAEEWEAVFAKTGELAQLVVAAVNACDRLAPGLPPDKLEASVLALVEAARAWHECSMVSDTWFDMKTHGLDEALARSEALIVALAPFAHLGGEP